MAYDAKVARAALQVLLDVVPAEVFLLSASGKVLEANAAARALLRREPTQTLAALHREGGPDPALFEVTKIERTALLAIRRVDDLELRFKTSRAAARWELTRRETEVLACLGRGATNQRIASELGCTEATVEVHVSRILDKARAESRAELIVFVLTLAS